MKKNRIIQIIREEIEKVVKVSGGGKYFIGADEVSREDVLEYKYKTKKSGYRWKQTNQVDGTFIKWDNIEESMKMLLEKYGKGNVIITGDTNGGDPVVGVLVKDQLAEGGEINEMATFYKTKGDKGAAKAALKKAKEKYKVGTALYNTLDTLEKKGEIDYKALSKETGKDVASYNNPKSRGVLEKDLADFIEFEVGKRGRKADPNAPKKVKSAKKEKQAPKKNKKDEKSEISYSTSSGTMTTTKDATDKEIKKATKAIIKSKTPRKLKSGGDTDIKSKLDTLITDMKAKAKEYKESEGAEREKITKELKKMTTEKTQLMDKYDDSISDMDKNQELN